jgi:hypothetical protein
MSAPPLYQGPASVSTARLRLLKRKPLGAQRLEILAAACGIRGQRRSGCEKLLHESHVLLRIMTV